MWQVVCLVAAGLWGALAERGAAAEPPPNVVIVLADDLGFADLGCYGGEIATPHLDGLAAGGVRFTQAYNTARCWPSRAALLTGYYAQHVARDSFPGGQGGSQGKRPVWAKLLPEYLKSAGYRCYHSGKWHVDGPVLAGGFDRSLDMRNQGNYFSPRGNSLDDKPVPPGSVPDGYYATVATADHAVECLREHAREHAGRPFFSYIAFIAPHFPLHALPEDIARYAGKYADGYERLRQTRHDRQVALGLLPRGLAPLERDVGPPYHFPEALMKLGANEINRPLPWESLTAGQRDFQATKMAIHAAMVDRMDREIGRVLEQLRTMQAFDNTLVLFASDNGASAEMMVRDGGHDPEAAPGSGPTYLCLGPGFSSAANTPFRRHKTWVHEGGIATPLVAHWPKGIVARGEMRTTPVHLIDVLPTVLELAGVEPPAEVGGAPVPPRPGRSLVPALRGNTPIEREALWWLHEGNRAVRVADWKLVAAKNQPWELYNLAEDRAETRNLAPELPERVLELERRWSQLGDSLRVAPAAAPPSP
jgi:arylsulfatase